MPREDLLQLRRGHEAQWEVVNPVLDDGEPGYAEDSRVLKIGDGSTNWLDLPAVIGDNSELTALLTGHIGNTSNPHGVTKAQVGLGNVDNTSDATKNSAAATLINKTIAAGSNTITGLGTGNFAANVVDTDTSLAANSDTRLASQKAVKAYIDALIAAADAMVFKGVIDCSANPNYPAADRGWTYRVSVSGKIGGGSGINVEAGDLLICITDGTLAGTQAAVGAQWNITQTNLDGAVIGPASATDATPAVFDGASGKLLKNVSFAAFKTSLALANVDNTSDANKPVSTAQAAALALKASQVADLSGLTALAAGSVAVVYMDCRASTGDGGAGMFVWRAGNQSANVTLDPQQGIWIAPSSASTGSSGAWQRQYVGAIHVEWFGATGSGADESSKVQAALNLVPAAGGLVIIRPGIKFNPKSLTFPARCNMQYRLDDDLSSPGPTGDLASSEWINFSANSSYPVDPTGGAVNERRMLAPFHPAHIIDVRKDIAGHDAYLAPGQSRTNPARASYIICDEQETAFWIQYVQFASYDPFSALNIACVRRTVLLDGVGTSDYTSVPPIGTVITGSVSGAKGFVLDVSSTRTTVLWFSGRFVVGDHLIDNNETTVATVSAASYIGTPHQPLSQSLETGAWSIGLVPGKVRQTFAVGGRIGSSVNRTMGQFINEVVAEPGFTWVDNYEAGTPEGYEIIYDATTVTASRRRLTLRKLNSSAQHANVGACRLHTSFDNAALMSGSSFNVASVVRNSTGQYTITPTVNWVLADYCPQVTGTNPADFPKPWGIFNDSLIIRNYNSSGTLTDLSGPIHVACFGGDI